MSIDDIEVGATVFSLTAFASNGFPRPGTVIDNAAVGDPVPIVRFFHGAPIIELWPVDDIDPGTVSCQARDARGMASNLHTWIGRQKRLDHRERAQWSAVAAVLDEAGMAGSLLPRAGAREKAERAARRAAS